MRIWNTRTRAQNGQALVEVAILLPVLIGLMLGVIELGRYAYIAILIGNAARAGAAFGSQSTGQAKDSTGILNAAQYDFAGGTTGSSTTNNGQPVSKLTVNSSFACYCDSGGALTSQICDDTVNPNAGTCATGRWVVLVTVTAQGDFNALFSYPGIPSPITLTRTAVMRVAQ